MLRDPGRFTPAIWNYFREEESHMAIWMDMTNSLQTWKGGVVGIVRAELEIAKNMKRCDPDVRF